MYGATTLSTSCMRSAQFNNSTVLRNRRLCTKQRTAVLQPMPSRQVALRGEACRSTGGDGDGRTDRPGTLSAIRRVTEGTVLTCMWTCILSSPAVAAVTLDPTLIRAPFGLVTWLDFMLFSGVLLFTFRFVDKHKDGTTINWQDRDSSSSTESLPLGQMSARDMRNHVLSTAAADNCAIAIKEINPRLSEAVKHLESSVANSSDPVVHLLQNKMSNREWSSFSAEEQSKLRAEVGKDMATKIAASQTEMLLVIMTRGLSK
eukprot:gene13941-19877_t